MSVIAVKKLLTYLLTWVGGPIRHIRLILHTLHFATLSVLIDFHNPHLFRLSKTSTKTLYNFD